MKSVNLEMDRPGFGIWKPRGAPALGAPGKNKGHGTRLGGRGAQRAPGRGRGEGQGAFLLLLHECEASSEGADALSDSVMGELLMMKEKTDGSRKETERIQ